MSFRPPDRQAWLVGGDLTLKILRRMYDWVLGWAETPYGPAALFVLAFCEASFFPVPPDILLIALALSLPARALWYATLASLGSVVGGVAGYLIGFLLWQSLAGFFFEYVPGFTPSVFEHVQGYFERYDFMVVFAAGFTPIPYKIITIGAGVFGVNFPVFLFASIISRSARFFLVAWLLKQYGAPVRGFIEKYFNWLALAFMALLVGGFALIGILK